MTYRTSLPLHTTEQDCPPNCNKPLKEKRKKQENWLKKTCNKKFDGPCKVKNRRRKKKNVKVKSRKSKRRYKI